MTAYYAWQSQRMAAEMELSRKQKVAPQLVASVALVDQGEAVIRVTNVGQGAALDADLVLEWEARGDGEHANHVVHWTPSVITPFERSDFFAPMRPHPVIAHMAQAFPRVRLRGTVRDALGAERTVEDELDVAGYWQQLRAAKRTRVGYDPNEQALRSVAHQLERTARSLDDLVRIGRGQDLFVNLRESLSRGHAPGAPSEEGPAQHDSAGE